MSQSAVAWTDLSDSAAAGECLGKEIRNSLDGRVDAAIVFASPKFEYTTLLQAIDSTCSPRCMVGCSSAGEFTNRVQGTSMACVVALRADDMAFSASIGRGLASSRTGAARDIVSGFRGVGSREYAFRSALILTDALAGHADELVEELTLLTAGAYQLVGGGAGDDADFQHTHVFLGTEAVPDAAVALEILSNKPIGIGVQHAWEPASAPLRVTEAIDSRLISLNASPAIEAFQEHAEKTGQTLDRDNPLPFFLHNVIGIDTGVGHKLRVPLTLHEDGSISCASEVPEGATVHIMGATGGPAEAARTAVASAIKQLDGNKPQVAIFFDCVATRLRMGGEFGVELSALQDALNPAPFAGCNTYGQIARAEGQFSGFHNCTAVVCILPE